MLPRRILKIKDLRLAKNAFRHSETIQGGKALNRSFPTFDTCSVKLLGLISLLVLGVYQASISWRYKVTYLTSTPNVRSSKMQILTQKVLV